MGITVEGVETDRFKQFIGTLGNYDSNIEK